MNNLILALLISLNLANVVQAESIMVRTDRVVNVYDGDTFSIDLPNDICVIDIICRKLPIRVVGIDAPEIKGKCYDEFERAKMARQYLSNRLHHADTIELRNLQRDSRFRIDASVYINGENVADEMIMLGLARPYDGKTKRLSWCK